MTTPTPKKLIAALDDGYRHPPHEMLGYFLSRIMHQWQLPEWQHVPNDVAFQIDDAIGEYGTLVKSLPPFSDILGPLYMELRSKGSKQMLGQYFTPWSIASMMSKITAGQRPPPGNGKLIRICDPACDSGVMMLTFLNTVHSD